MGINAHEKIVVNDFGVGVPDLKSLTGYDFKKTLLVCELLYEILEPLPPRRTDLVGQIKAALDQATIDLGVRWKDGMFLPVGAKELDEKLIDEPFQWLKGFPNEREDFRKAVAAYTEKRYNDGVGNCYLAVEGLAKKLLGNDRALDKNREDLLRLIGLSQEWKALLSNFINYAHEYARHASENRRNVNPIEVEGFLYLTGLLVRMIVQTIPRAAPAKR